MKPALLFAAAALVFASCASRAIVEYERAYGPDAPVPAVAAAFTETPIQLDGKLDEEVWRRAPAYTMVEPIEAPAPGRAASKLQAKWRDFYGGAVRFAYTKDTLYIAVAAEDGDLVQFNQKDQQPHWRSGDLVEIMVKSEKGPGFWECYATPCGHRTTLRYIARGYCNDTMADFRDDFRTAVRLDGTLNNRADVDHGYTMEIAIPFQMLEALDGVPVTADGGWKIFVGRYNYDWRYSYRQLSGFPMMPVPKFESSEYFAPIVFQK